MAERDRARAAKARLVERIRGAPGVVGVGLERTSRGYRVKVNVTDAAAAEQVPEAVDGVEVRIAVVGPITPQR